MKDFFPTAELEVQIYTNYNTAILVFRITISDNNIDIDMIRQRKGITYQVLCYTLKINKNSYSSFRTFEYDQRYSPDTISSFMLENKDEDEIPVYSNKDIIQVVSIIVNDIVDGNLIYLLRGMNFDNISLALLGKLMVWREIISENTSVDTSNIFVNIHTPYNDPNLHDRLSTAYKDDNDPFRKFVHCYNKKINYICN
jgi:hypothetical protein